MMTSPATDRTAYTQSFFSEGRDIGQQALKTGLELIKTFVMGIIPTLFYKVSMGFSFCTKIILVLHHNFLRHLCPKAS